MTYDLFVKTCREGLRKTLRSRKINHLITPDRFDCLNKKYFEGIKPEYNFRFISDKNDFTDLLFILRYGYRLWIDIIDYHIEIYHFLPKEYYIVKDVNITNHPHVPKSFPKGQKMYLSDDLYNTCNWINGIPLWDKPKKRTGLSESCQINYDYIKPIFRRVNKL
jgi:hypothetical protein